MEYVNENIRLIHGDCMDYMRSLPDKFNRLENLILNGECEIKDESIKDTLMDLANYAIMLYMEVE